MTLGSCFHGYEWFCVFRNQKIFSNSWSEINSKEGIHLFISWNFPCRIGNNIDLVSGASSEASGTNEEKEGAELTTQKNNNACTDVKSGEKLIAIDMDIPYKHRMILWNVKCEEKSWWNENYILT